jgi:phosphoribosylglycinamide formyltransferase-1
MKKRVGILISGRGSNMAAILQAARDPAYPAAIACVIANRPDAKGLETARAEGVPAVRIDHKNFPSREVFEDAVHRVLVEHETDFVALAGFMRVLTSHFITRWDGRLLNIHPSLLPSFRGLHTHERALEEGVKLHGCTVHFVVPELDAGPIIAQGAVAVRPDDTPDSLAARVLAVENALYPRVVGAMAAGQITLRDGRAELKGTIPDTSLVSLA